MSRINALLSPKTKREILDLAEKWWERVGRHNIRKGINQRQDAPDVRTGGKALGSAPLPNMVSRAPIEADLNSGILRALPWEDLRGEEQARVMFAYFSNIWLPEHPEERRVH